MTVVIGFNWPVEHDNAVAVIVDGELIFASEEERWTRHKHSIDEPPINALVQAFKFLKDKYGLSPNDVDAYAVNYEPKLYRRVDRAYWLRHVIINSVKSGYYNDSELGLAIDYLKSKLGLDNYLKYAYHMIRYSIKKAGFNMPSDVRIIPVEHHLAHAASAYYFSGFSNTAVLTIDGVGEFDSTVVWRVRNGEFEKLLSIPIWLGSIGSLWDYVTYNLIFTFLEGPGKVMGLAPYGSLDKDVYGKFLEVFDLENKDYPYILRDRFRVSGYRGGLFEDSWRQYTAIANFITGGPIEWDPHGELDKRAVNIAYALQKFTEEAMLRLAEWARGGHTNEQYLALAGGVALNAKANMVIHYAKLFSDIFIFPAANDAGTTVGAAAYVYEHVLGGKMKNNRLRTVYLGPEYGDDEVKKIVERSRFNAEYIGDDVNEVADLVAKGYVIAWYQGRAELGPRALGNRSIVADPRRADMWRFVNGIKGREWWRPLAPSLLVEDASKYFIDPVPPHQFMILMFRYKEGMREVVPAVYHVDGTARPQTVAKDENPTWYELIKAFKDLTGEGIILNTSFNLAGEPLVETPQDALKSFTLGGFDAIYIQGWLIKKR